MPVIRKDFGHYFLLIPLSPKYLTCSDTNSGLHRRTLDSSHSVFTREFAHNERHLKVGWSFEWEVDQCCTHTQVCGYLHGSLSQPILCLSQFFTAFIIRLRVPRRSPVPSERASIQPTIGIQFGAEPVQMR
jgi:hypothetical protein